MPLTPKFEWEETDLAVTVRASVPGLTREHADVTATDSMLKVNCPPYLLLIDLHAEVDEARSVATLATGSVTFTLVKKAPGVWGTLSAVGERDALAARRNASIDRSHARLEAQRLERLQLKKTEDKAAMERQWDVERRKRQEIERRKEEELKAERDSMQEWQQRLSAPGSSPAAEGHESDYESDEGEGQPAQASTSTAAAAAAVGSSLEAAQPDHADYHGRGYRQGRGQGVPSTSTTTNGDMDHGAATDDASETAAAAAAAAATAEASRRRRRDAAAELDAAQWEKDEPLEDRWERAMREVAPPSTRPYEPPVPQADTTSFTPLPPPRTRLQPVPVVFTALETGHLPARQNREAEIKEYRRREKDSRLLTDSADVADRQPVFLKDKGDALFQQGNFRGALNAYSRALELDPHLPAVLSNRAACHLKLGDAEACVDDAGMALQLLDKRRTLLEAGELAAQEDAALRKTLLRVHVRRGQALGQLGRYPEAAEDYRQALRCDRGNAQLESDLQELLAALAPADAAALRQRGDARFRSGDHEGATQAYGALLGLPATLVADTERLAGLSNRAACFIVLERYAQAVHDCNAALSIALPQLLPDRPVSWDSHATTASHLLSRQPDSSCSPEAGPLQAWVEDAAREGAELNSARLTSIGRLLSRRGAARTYLKQSSSAADDLTAAAALLQRAGEPDERVGQLLADAAKLRGAEAGGSGHPVTGGQGQIVTTHGERAHGHEAAANLGEHAAADDAAAANRAADDAAGANRADDAAAVIHAPVDAAAAVIHAPDDAAAVAHADDAAAVS